MGAAYKKLSRISREVVDNSNIGNNDGDVVGDRVLIEG
jgi:hypothetical protein